MSIKTYYVYKPTTHNRLKVSYGDPLDLTETQARPLRNGGFICSEKEPAEKIGELVAEIEQLKSQLSKLTPKPKTESSTTSKDESKESYK